ncbi:MAG: GAF domain-containing protein, partial [Chloroflexota bacterium]
MVVVDPILSKSRVDTILRVTQMIETAPSLGDLLTSVFGEIIHTFEYTACNVLLSVDETHYVMHAFPPHQTSSQVLSAQAAPLLQQIMQSRQPLQLNVDDINETDEYVQLLLKTDAVRSFLLIPLIAQDQVMGVLAFCSTSTTASHSTEEVVLLRLFASQLTSVIVVLRNTEITKRRDEELILNEIATTVTSVLDTHQVYLLVVQKLNTYFEVDAGSILLIDEMTGALQFVMTIEGSEERLAGKYVPVGQGVVGHVARTGQWEIVHDAPNDPRFYSKISEDVGYQTRSILCVPMIAKGRVIGVLELLNKINGHFTEDDAQRLTRMASLIGVAIQNARLFQQVTDTRDRLAAILNSVAEGIVMTNMHGNVLSVNPMASQLFGADETDLLYQPLGELIEDLYEQAHATTTPSWQNDEESDSALPQITELELGSEQRRFIRHLRLPVRDVDGKMYGQIEVFHDITKERELTQLRDDYTSMLVHDMRAPLTSIINGIVMVQRGLVGPISPQQQELLAIAHQGSQTMLELINNLLDISKMEEGHMPLDVEPLVPYMLIDDVIERLEASTRTRQLTIEQKLAVG